MKNNYLISIIWLLALSVCCGNAGKSGGTDRNNNDNKYLATNCENENKYLSISELQSLCRLPGTCGQKLPCEDKVLKIEGLIDYRNVYDKRRYPQLPYEKFIITDSTGSISIDVWLDHEKDNTKLFDRLMKAKSENLKKIRMEVLVSGVDVQAGGRCIRTIRLSLVNENSVCFKTIE